MPSANVEVVQRLLDAFNADDLGALEALAEDAELQDEPRMPGAGWNRGHDGAVRWAAKLRESFGRLTLGPGIECGRARLEDNEPTGRCTSTRRGTSDASSASLPIVL